MFGLLGGSGTVVVMARRTEQIGDKGWRRRRQRQWARLGPDSERRRKGQLKASAMVVTAVMTERRGVRPDLCTAEGGDDDWD